MYVGQLEGIYKHNIQRYMVANTYEAHALLLEKGMTPDQLRFDTNEPLHTEHRFYDYTVYAADDELPALISACLFILRCGQLRETAYDKRCEADV